MNDSLKNNKGFTLVEVMIAIFVLTISISSLMSLLGSSLFSAKYARNEIIANYLSQEVIDYIRNERDTMVFLHTDNPLDGWKDFYFKYKECSDEAANCYMDINSRINVGPIKCPEEECFLFFDEDAVNNVFYNYSEIGEQTNFQRKLIVSMNENNNDQIDVEVLVYWKNGGVLKSKSLKTSFMKWQ